MSPITIALDAMGGDYGPSVIIPAAAECLKNNDHLNVIFVGDESTLKPLVDKYCQVGEERFTMHHASEVVNMDEPPAQALRFKKDSSMRVAINLVKQSAAHACVSAGNTGALMATAKFVLKTLPGIHRPAISAVLPTVNPQKHVRMLDLGANVDSSAEQLVQFAVMGSVLTKSVDNINRPKIALLNIGEESIKGNEQVKQTAQLLDKIPELNYMGYIEGDAVYQGEADVVVCDGFVGNVALKTSEGIAKLISQYIKNAFKHNWLTKLSGLAAGHVLRRLSKQLDPARYNGASLLGLNGTVVKSHGGANMIAWQSAITEAMLEVQQNIPNLISTNVEVLLSQQA